ncbi:MAG: Rieske 2Fe-2S domain-containing protein [Acidobacteriia bacterium]|nr:Rieske 2Fe-2S domain-containing protein [Terriglobia bacterium]
MPNFVKVAASHEIPEGTGKAIEVDGKAIALFNVHGKFYALDNTCAHRGGPLGDGMVDDNIVTCPWHGWQWDVVNGQSLFNPQITVKAYPVTVEGEDIKVALD